MLHSIAMEYGMSTLISNKRCYFMYFAQSCLKEKHAVGSENKLPLTSPETLPSIYVQWPVIAIMKYGNHDTITALVFTSLKAILKKATS